MQLTQIQRVRATFEINSKKLKSGNGNFKNNSGRNFFGQVMFLWCMVVPFGRPVLLKCYFYCYLAVSALRIL